MNKRRQTRSPPFSTWPLAVVVLGPNGPPLPAQGTGKRMIELRGAATFGSGTSPSKAATARWVRTSWPLHAEYQARLNQTSKPGAATPALQIEQRARSDRRGVVIIDAAASGGPYGLERRRRRS